VLRGDVIPEPLAGDPVDVREKIAAYRAAQELERQRESTRRAVARMEARRAESARQWEASGGMAGFEARMRAVRDAEAVRGPAACVVCGRKVDPGYAAELRKKGLPSRHVFCR
jgi:hypothetical protein